MLRVELRLWKQSRRPLDRGEASRRSTTPDVERFIGEFISRLVGEELDDDYAGLALVNLGLDSLGSVELSAAIEQEYGVVIEPAGIRLSMTVTQLAKAIRRHVPDRSRA